MEEGNAPEERHQLYPVALLTSLPSPLPLARSWTGSDALTITWARINGENVCGAYCTAWGCGANNTNKWSQAQCGPNTTSTAA